MSRLRPQQGLDLGERPRRVMKRSICDVVADATSQPHDVQEVQVGVLLGLYGSVERTRHELVPVQPIRREERYRREGYSSEEPGEFGAIPSRGLGRGFVDIVPP